MAHRYYLPEYHEFEHIARAHWPLIVTAADQLDWVEAVSVMESWLNSRIGNHYSEWAWHNGTSIDYWQACVAFKRARSKTLFLLAWA